MSCQLPADCLNEIFEYLEEDKPALYSCLLVNRLWCKISIRILWRNIWNFRCSIAYQHRPKVSLKILSTLIACLPDESKKFLNNNGVLIPTPTSEPPLFNYPAFCKFLSIYDIFQIVEVIGEKPYDILNIKTINYLVVNEVIKMFMNQISALKKLIYISTISINSNICFSGANLVDLSELCCSSDINPEFYYQLSQTCHNLHSFAIDFEPKPISNELKELISSQRNLKELSLSAYDGGDWTDILSSLMKHSNTLIKLYLNSDNDNLPLSFIASFSNLQEIEFSFFGGYHFEDFEKLQYVIFPKLQILDISYDCPKPEYVINFLKNNGKNLQECYFGEDSSVLNSIIAEFCPNLKKLFVIFDDDELDILITIFNNCQYLESIKIWCGINFLIEKEVLEIVAKHSSENFCELKLYNLSESELLPEDLKTFFVSWKNRPSKKSLSLIIIKDYNYNSLEINEENMKIINHYKNFGIIKFKTVDFEEEELKYV